MQKRIDSDAHIITRLSSKVPRLRAEDEAVCKPPGQQLRYEPRFGSEQYAT